MCYTKHRFACGHTEKREDRECHHKRSSGLFAKANRCEKTRSEKQRSSICKKCEYQQREGDGEEKRRHRHESYRGLDDRERHPNQPTCQPTQPGGPSEAEIIAREEREFARQARKEGKSEKQIKQDELMRQYTRERNAQRKAEKEAKKTKAQNIRSLDDREQKKSNPERSKHAHYYREEEKPWGTAYPPAGESSRPSAPQAAPYMAYASSSSSSQQIHASSSSRHSYQTPHSSYASFPEPEKVAVLPSPAHRASYHPGPVQHQSYHATLEHAEPAHIWTAQKPTDKARWTRGGWSVPANNVVDQYLREKAAIRPPPSPTASSSSDDEYILKRSEHPRGSFDSTRGFQYQPGAATQAKARRAERASYVPPRKPWQSSVAVPEMSDGPQKVHHLSQEHTAKLSHRSRRASVSASSKHHHSSAAGEKDRSRPPVSTRHHQERSTSQGRHSRRPSISERVNNFLGRKESDESFVCHTARQMESGSRR